ncbi:RNA polymerase sigma factor [Cytobacillus purgationiresistens]|uniref:RNA polymerase sigma factor n=1 Tax=Cytobacillus purgationiresistens TaxID=863449 RepID=A0ABU0API7_9BACI|nr:RNA polymerase sigma factor [Cytobacillus purgationiresistens]MDQ0272779.1 RNA polymerase sigma-70 factor (ECF subfamily) [Cytobacillus purgationiresistens]
MKKNDVHARFVTIVNDHKEDFYRLAYSYVKNQEDALDIVQDSIKKALMSIDTIQNPHAIKSWFYKIVVRTALDFLRKHKRLTVADDGVIEFLSNGKEDDYENFDLQQALEDLPVQYKTVITLRYFEDLKMEEIAEIVDENISTVKTRIYRGLKLLRITLTEENKAHE